jgi:hypothetical protein
VRNDLDIDSVDANVLVRYLEDNWFGAECRWRDFCTMQRLVQVGLDSFAGKLLDTNNSCERKHRTLMDAAFNRRVFRDPAKMFRVLLVKAEQLANLDIDEQHHGDRQHAAVRRLPLLAWRLLLRALAALQNPARQPKAAQHSQRYFYVPHQEACGPDEGAAGGGGEGTSASVGGDNDGDKDSDNDSDNDSNNDSDNVSDNDSNNESDSGGGASAAVLERIGQYEEAAAVVGKAGAGAPDVPAGHHLVDTKLMSCSCPYNAVWGRTPAVSGRLGCVHLLMALLHNPEGTLKAKDQGRLKRACVALNSGFASLRARAGAGGDKGAVWHDEGLATKAGCECAQRPRHRYTVDCPPQHTLQ